MKLPVSIHQDDAGLVLAFYCQDEEGNPLDLTQLSVDFLIYDRDVLVNEDRTACSKPDAAVGWAEYRVAPGDTEAKGLFHGWLRLQNGEAEVRSIGTIPIEIR